MKTAKITQLTLIYIFTMVFGVQTISKMAANPISLAANEDIKGWRLVSSNPNDYEIGVSKESVNMGSSSGYVRSVNPLSKGFATLKQEFSAQSYLGKRIRLTAFIKTKDVIEGANLWMSVEQQVNGKKEEPIYKPTAYDNMQNTCLVGTSDWKKYTIVLDVKNNSALIQFGLNLQFTGEVWIADVKIEVVDNDTPVTDLLNTFILNGSHNQYETYLDKSRLNPGSLGAQTILFKKSKGDAMGFGSIEKSLDPTPYLGKRLRFKAWVKTKGIQDWVALGLTAYYTDSSQTPIDQVKTQNIRNSFVNLSPISEADAPINPPYVEFYKYIKHTTDWTQYEIVMDIPTTCYEIYYQLLLPGKGQAWIDNIQFETVTSSVPLSVYPQDKKSKVVINEQPTNLNFDNK